MAIRPATLEDLESLLDLAEIMHAESPRYSRLKYSRQRTEDHLRLMLTDPRGAVFVAERDGKIVGAAVVWADMHWTSEDVVAEEVALFVLPEARGSMAAVRLICTMKAWKDAKRAQWLQVGTSTNVEPERTAALYEFLGFKRCGFGLEV